MVLIDGSGKRITGSTAEIMEFSMKERYEAYARIRKKNKVRKPAGSSNRIFFRVSDMDVLSSKWDSIIRKMMDVRKS